MITTYLVIRIFTAKFALSILSLSFKFIRVGVIERIATVAVVDYKSMGICFTL